MAEGEDGGDDARKKKRRRSDFEGLEEIAVGMAERARTGRPPNDSAHCWGSLPTRPVEFLREQTLPFLRRDGVGIYSSVKKGELDEAPPAQRRKVAAEWNGRWSPWATSIPPRGVPIGGFMRITEFLGGGVYGRVYGAEIESAEFPEMCGLRVAVKFYSMCQAARDSREVFQGPLFSFYREAEMMSAVQGARGSDAVVEILGTFAYMADPASPSHEYYPALVMEYANCGSALDVLNGVVSTYDPAGCGLPELRMLSLLGWKMCAALGKLHAAGFYQQDVKPANFLCFEPEKRAGDLVVKLGDMGLTCTYRSFGRLAPGCRPTGAPLFTSPELLSMRQSGATLVDSPDLVASSERYSLASSIRDMFWAARKCFGGRRKTCWSREDREHFVRVGRTMFKKSCVEALRGELKRQGLDHARAISLLGAVDAKIWEMISAEWQKRPPLGELEALMRALWEEL